MQCHLETTSRPLPNVVARFEHGPFDYRPGQPLTDYFLFFDRAPSSGGNDNFEIAHAAYRLRKSKCFQASEMTCTTCHNPHDVAARRRKRLPATTRPAANATQAAHTAGVAGGNDCASCHMPRRRTDDAVHVVMTDHYIQRRRPARDLLAARAETMDSGYRGEVVPYYPDKGADELYVAVAQVRDGANLDGGIPRLRQAIERSEAPAAGILSGTRQGYSNPATPMKRCAGARKRSGSVPDSARRSRNSARTLIQAGDSTRAVATLRDVSGPSAPYESRQCVSAARQDRPCGTGLAHRPRGPRRQ